MARYSKAKVYVGDLGYGTTKEELEDKFSKYGPLRSVWIARKPPGFAFVEFEDSRDAEDAVKALRGVRINGRRARVEMSSGKPRFGGNRDRGPPPRGRPSYDDYRPQRRSRSRSESRSVSPPPARRQNRSRSRS